MKKRFLLICLMMCTSLCFGACSKEDKASEAEEPEVQEEVVDFEAAAEEPVEQEPLAMETPVEPPAPVEEVSQESLPAEPVEEVAAEPTPEPQADYSVEETGDTTLYTTDTLKMRKGPSADDFEVVGMLKKGSQITSTGKVNGYKGDGKVWYRIKRTDSDEPAFVAGDYVSAEKPKEEEKKAETPAATPEAPAVPAAPAATPSANLTPAVPAATPAPAAAPAPAAPAPVVADAPKNGHKYPDSKIAADWDRTGANSAGKKWSELDEGTKEALRIHYDDHGCSGW